MANPEPPTAVAQLRAAASPSEQLIVLKLLKNQIIGHPVRKEYLVRHGLIACLVSLLSSALGDRKGASSESANGSAAPVSVRSTSTDVHYQTLTLLGSLAQGLLLQLESDNNS